jgi:hypothetical protein
VVSPGLTLGVIQRVKSSGNLLADPEGNRFCVIDTSHG